MGRENASGLPQLFRHDDATNLSNVVRASTQDVSLRERAGGGTGLGATIRPASQTGLEQNRSGKRRIAC
jgi:hypothetical protein